MNDSSTTFSEKEGKETAESRTWQLTVVVIVLGTLVGMVVIVVGVWLCVECIRRGRRPGKRRWREYQERMFPPPQRELVELGRLPASTQHRLNLQPDANNNCSGISRGLGLGASYPAERIPSLPSPQSWTPSPPFDPQQVQAPPQRLRLPHPGSGANPSVIGGANDVGLDVGSALYGSRAGTSPYNPRYNTPATDYSGERSLRTRSGYRIRGVDQELKGRRGGARERWEALGDRRERRRSNRERKAHRRLPRHQHHGTNEFREGRGTYRNPRIYLQGPSENAPDPLQEGSSNELPTACSSRHGSPRLHHRAPRSHLNPSRTRPLHDSTPGPLQDSDVDSGCWQENHNPSVRIKCSSRPHWMKHHQANADYGMLQNQGQPCLCHSPHTPPCSQKEPYLRHDGGVVVPRHLALKYGFCPTCGVQRSLEKPRNPGYVPYGRQLKSRYTQTEREEFDSLNSNYDLTHDPTPSMSWDNLTPDPSPVLTNTPEDSQALETEAVAAAADEEACNDVSSHAGAHLDRSSAGAMAFGIRYTGESSSSNGA